MKKKRKTFDWLVTKWPTCACGQLCRDLPRTSVGMPSDIKLQQMGGIFCSEISVRDWKKALRVFYQIEARTEELLQCT
jgi:hypothetical protein